MKSLTATEMPLPPTLQLPVRVMVIDPHPAVLLGLKATLRAGCGIEITENYLHLEAWTAASTASAADVALIGFDLNEFLAVWRTSLGSGLDLSRCILMTDGPGEAIVSQALTLGFRCVFSKKEDPASLLDAIRAVNNGDQWSSRSQPQTLMRQLLLTAQSLPNWPGDTFALSTRQRQIISGVLQGCSSREIASYLSVSCATVSHDLTQIYRLYGVHHRRKLLATLAGCDQVVDNDVRPADLLV